MAVSPASSAADTSFVKSLVIFSSVEFSTAPTCAGVPSVVLSSTGDSFTGSAVGVSFAGSSVGVSFTGSSVGVSFAGSSVGVSFTGSSVGVSFTGSSVGISFVFAAGEESYPPTETSVPPSELGQ